jgi:2-dehydro-3-deoxyphosphogluconate aldolase/(4S)-4-hydroxy-2-oxoglutarate aldolase
MASFSRLHVLQKMMDIKVIPLFYNPDLDTACKIADACARGGATVLEFTNRGDFAQEVFSPLVKHLEKKHPHIVLGVGTVMEEMTAASYINIGANFIVSPCLNKNIGFLCNRRKVAYFPGCGSVTEISEAEAIGVEICKIFPSHEVGGPKFIKAVKGGPMPWSQMMPSGGVDNNSESISSWINAGACCLGMGSSLITKSLVAEKNFNAIEENVRTALTLARQVKSQ